VGACADASAIAVAGGVAVAGVVEVPLQRLPCEVQRALVPAAKSQLHPF